MILGLSMKARMGSSKFIVIIPKTTFGVLNFVFQRARERWGVSAACVFCRKAVAKPSRWSRVRQA